MTSKRVEAQFIKAYEEYADAIFRYCYYRVFNRELAKDLSQEVFMKTWRSITEGNEVKNIRAFLYRAARNIVIDHSRKKHESSLDELHDQGFDPAVELTEKIYNQIDAHTAIGQIEKLDDMYREVLLLRFVDGFSPKEIAGMIGETQNVVSVRINRGLKQLRSGVKIKMI